MRTTLSVVLLLLSFNSTAVHAEEYQPGDKVVVVQKGQGFGPGIIRLEKAPPQESEQEDKPEAVHIPRSTETYRSDQEEGATPPEPERYNAVVPGQVVTVVETQDDWVHVTGHAPGWIQRDAVASVDDAAEILNTAVERRPKDRTWVTARARFYSDTRQHKQAAADYTTLIELSPADTYNYVQRGRAWRDHRAYDKAIADFDEAIRREPDQSFHYSERARTRQMQREYEKAIADFDEAIRLEPNQPFHYSDRAQTWQMQGEHEKAIADYNQAIQMAPDNAGLYLNRSMTWTFQRRLDEALADCNQAIKLEPEDPYGYAARGRTYDQRKEFDKALADFDNAIQHDPLRADFYLGRGQVRKNQGEYAKAFLDYEKALELDPDWATTHRSMAQIWATCPDKNFRDGAKAIKHATRACELVNYEYSWALDMLAAAYAETGDFENAVKWQTKAHELYTEEVMKDYGHLLELYKQSQPYQEKPKK